VSSTHAKMAAVTLMVVKAPRTAGELAQLLGIDVHTSLHILNALVEEGLVDDSQTRPRKHVGGKAPRLYRWTGGAA